MLIDEVKQAVDAVQRLASKSEVLPTPLLLASAEPLPSPMLLRSDVHDAASLVTFVAKTPDGVAASEVFDCYVGAERDVENRAGQESEIPNFKGSYLGRFPLVLADFWTSDHLSERSRSVDAFSGTRARGTLTLKRR